MEPKSTVDDTALNGIMLYCGQLGLEFKGRTPITSKVGPFGEWEKLINCPTPMSYAVGFELRSQKYQGTDTDDSAAINMKLYCSDGNVFEGYPESRNYRNARYTGPQMCSAGKGICGIQTEVEAYQFLGDDTSLNNVRVKCCNANNFYKKY
ncbi:unnamed protein product [Allacma fusca]|uniref:Uncharacterized protein n=1 Tax=Allacma fusca TaxID=39272 RepID=A0A8J2LP31_9HEXA|nr:unnamed protein product [Allacma fusca]